MKNVTLFIVLLTSMSNFSHANGLKFSTAVGWPYLLTTSLGMSQNHINYYANYKLGLDDGFSVGLEKQSGHNVFGVFIGAVGARQTNDNCESDSNCNPFDLSIADQKTTQGIGVSYEYRFSSTRDRWALRVEAGYGKESKTNTERIDGNIQIVYHF